jgi:hypothetical protein
VQIISTSDFSSKLDEFLNQVEVVWVLAVYRGVVGSHRFTLRYWLAPEVLLPLRARDSPLCIDLLVLGIVSRWSCDAFQPRQPWR